MPGLIGHLSFPPPNWRKAIGPTVRVGPFFLRHRPITALGAKQMVEIGL